MQLKASIEELESTKHSFHEMEQAMGTSLKSKGDLVWMKRQLRQLRELINKLQIADKQDDGMFTRCASCDKNLVNLQAKIADYSNWKGMPFRDPKERIATMGHGFSRLLK
jgi:uncharacterized protein with PIN domain